MSREVFLSHPVIFPNDALFLLFLKGLEVQCRDGSVPHLFLALKSAKERDDLFVGIMNQKSVKLDDFQQEAVTLQWQHGVLSNYDYLLYLNR